MQPNNFWPIRLVLLKLLSNQVGTVIEKESSIVKIFFKVVYRTDELRIVLHFWLFEGLSEKDILLFNLFGN